MSFTNTLSLSFSPSPPFTFPFHSRLSPPLIASFPNPNISPVSLFISALRANHRRRSPVTMSSSDARSNSPVNQSELKELKDESDFETIIASDGRISICGFGSLLSGMYTYFFIFIIVVVEFLVCLVCTGNECD